MNPKKQLFIPLSHNGVGLAPLAFIPAFLKSFTEYEIHSIVCGDSHADRAMNRIANDFIGSPCEEMLIIDTDIIFTERNVADLMRHDLPLVYGIYPKKDDAAEGCYCGFNEGETARPVPETSLVEVRRTGRGFMRVHRKVFEAMKVDNGGRARRFHNHGRTEWQFFRSGIAERAHSVFREGDVDEEGFQKEEWLSEDWQFCEDARELGFRTFVDSNIALGHIGQKCYRFPAEMMAPREEVRELAGVDREDGTP